MIQSLFFVFGFIFLFVLGFLMWKKSKTQLHSNQMKSMQGEYMDHLARRRSWFLILIEILKQDPHYAQKNEFLYECMDDWRIMYYETMKRIDNSAHLVETVIAWEKEISELYPHVETENMAALEMLTKLKESDTTKA